MQSLLQNTNLSTEKTRKELVGMTFDLGVILMTLEKRAGVEPTEGGST
jgi:hypothetical protein